MRNNIIIALEKALEKLHLKTDIELTDAKGHGDFATNIALKLAKKVKQSPMVLAQKIVTHIKSPYIKTAQVANPGFINIFLNEKSHDLIVQKILETSKDYGRSNQKKFINIEYVSANPTGFLHIGHGANAAFGSTLANILKFAGNKVVQEYYINDAGVQIEILGRSAFVRYQQLLGINVDLPTDAYKGQEIITVAKLLVKKFGDKYVSSALNAEIIAIFSEEAKEWMLNKIKQHLFSFGVVMDKYYSEKNLYEKNLINKALNKLPGLYKKDGATWVPTSKHGDDKDRVVIKKDQSFTYFAPDIAYHDVKLMAGYDELINVWGGDHINYALRMKIALNLLGLPSERLDIITIQMVRLIKDGTEFKMSKRSGTAFSLKDLINLVGKDAARFFMINRSNNTKLDFDITLATKRSQDNPVFSVQYAHARANQLLKKSKLHVRVGNYEGQELEIINLLQQFPDLILKIANTHRVNLLPQYLIDLSRAFNSFYSNPQLKIIDSPREANLLALTQAVKQVLNNGLTLMGVFAPEKM